MKNLMCYAFCFMSTANAQCFFFFKYEGTSTCILLFSVTLFLLARSYRFITLLIWLYILCKPTYCYKCLAYYIYIYIYIYIFFFLLLNWIKKGSVNIRMWVKFLIFDLGMLACQATLVPKFCILILSNLLQKTNSRTG